MTDTREAADGQFEFVFGEEVAVAIELTPEQLHSTITAEGQSRILAYEAAKDTGTKPKMAQFLASTIRQMIIVMSVDQYKKVLPVMQALKKREGLTNNSEALLWLLNQWNAKQTETEPPY